MKKVLIPLLAAVALVCGLFAVACGDKKPETVAVESVTLSATTANLTTGGDTLTLTATVTPDNATNKSVSWSSDHPEFASVSDAGVVTPVAAGTAVITASADGGKKTATCTVTVADPVAVTGVTLNNTALNLEKDGSATLTASVIPDNAANKAVSWKSSDTSKVTVDDKGVVTAVALGTANVTVTTADGNKTAVCAVTVYDIVLGANPKDHADVNLELISGKDLVLNIKGSDTMYRMNDNGSVASGYFDWSDNSVFHVSAGSTGTAKIFVGYQSISDQTNVLTINVTVTPGTDPLSQIVLSQEPLVLIEGTTSSINYHVEPGSAGGYKLTWESSNHEVLTIDEKGVITAVAAGTATVTVTASENLAPNITDDKKTSSVQVTVVNGQLSGDESDEIKVPANSTVTYLAAVYYSEVYVVTFSGDGVTVKVDNETVNSGDSHVVATNSIFTFTNTTDAEVTLTLSVGYPEEPEPVIPDCLTPVIGENTATGASFNNAVYYAINASDEEYTVTAVSNAYIVAGTDFTLDGELENDIGTLEGSGSLTFGGKTVYLAVYANDGMSQDPVTFTLSKTGVKYFKSGSDGNLIANFSGNFGFKFVAPATGSYEISAANHGDDSKLRITAGKMGGNPLTIECTAGETYDLILDFEGADTTPLTDVMVYIRESEQAEFDTIEVGVETTVAGGDYDAKIVQIDLEAGQYHIEENGSALTSDNLGDYILGGSLFESMTDSFEVDDVLYADNDGNFTVSEAGTYYLAVYTTHTFTVVKNAA